MHESRLVCHSLLRSRTDDQTHRGYTEPEPKQTTSKQVNSTSTPETTTTGQQTRIHKEQTAKMAPTDSLNKLSAAATQWLLPTRGEPTEKTQFPTPKITPKVKTPYSPRLKRSRTFGSPFPFLFFVLCVGAREISFEIFLLADGRHVGGELLLVAAGTCRDAATSARWGTLSQRLPHSPAAPRRADSVSVRMD